MLNRIVLLGRLTRDPELYYTTGTDPKAKVSFGLAVDRDYTKSDGTRETDFFEIEAWQKTAEFVNKYFKKGQFICLEGRLQRDEWMDKENVKRVTFKVTASNCYFSEKKPQDSVQTDQSSMNSTILPQGFDPFEDDESY